ncbi:unnamed protein product, partial [Phaeothamnion confervicola]
MDGKSYPARLLNLPCPVETHKTLDTATYFKSGDVGQMLIVYETKADFDRAAPISHVTEKDYFPHGLTPPMLDIVTRRFVKAWPEALRVGGSLANLDNKARRQEVAAAEHRLTRLMAVTIHEPLVETFEEVVDFEPWMLDPAAARDRRITGISFEIRGAGGAGKDAKEPTTLGGKHTLLGHRVLYDHPEIL